MSRLRGLVSGHGLDAVIVLIALAGAVGVAATSRADRAEDTVPTAFEVAAVAAAILSLLARRQAPFAVPAGTWAAMAALSLLDGRLIVGQPAISVAGMIASVLLGNLRDVRQARVGLAVVVVGAVTAVWNDPAHHLDSLFFIPAFFVVGWLVGFALHERTEQTAAAEERAARAEVERVSAARVAVAEERARIARELHDVVAHAVSVMVLQAGAVRRRLPEEAVEDGRALRNVEQAGRSALVEMRRLLDAMRSEGDGLQLAPQPGLDRLPALVDDVRGTGLDVDLDLPPGGPPRLSPALDLTAYRILQEGLTNVIKHSRARHVWVEVRRDGGQLLLGVQDDGCGDAGTGTAGHGLVGIRERVKVFGGDLDIGSRPSGGFALRVRLPVDER